jgi:hypothetical protein
MNLLEGSATENAQQHGFYRVCEWNGVGVSVFSSAPTNIRTHTLNFIEIYDIN